MQERPLLPTAGAVTNTALQVLLACLCSPAGEQTELGCGLISTYLQTEDTHALGPSQRGLSLYCQARPEPVEQRGSGQAVMKPNVKHAPIPFACPDWWLPSISANGPHCLIVSAFLSTFFRALSAAPRVHSLLAGCTFHATV